MKPRSEYVNHTISHREYYGQMVNDKVRNIVVRHFGSTLLERSTDEHFNDIPLRRWDSLCGSIGAAVPELPEGEWWSLGTAVCVAKEAARQYLDSLVASRTARDKDIEDWADISDEPLPS